MAEFYTDALKRSAYRNMKWYNRYLMKALNMQKEKRVRQIDKTIEMAEKLKEMLNEKRPSRIEVPLHEVEPFEDDSLMKPIEPEVLDLLYGSQEKGSGKRYLKQRYTKPPEDRFHFRICSNWDYGWQLAGKQARMVNHGRRLVTQTFYRRNNVAADAPNYPQPAGAMPSTCSAEYSCYFS